MERLLPLNNQASIKTIKSWWMIINPPNKNLTTRKLKKLPQPFERNLSEISYENYNKWIIDKKKTLEECF